MPLDVEKVRELMGARSGVEMAEKMGMAQPNFVRLISGGGNPKLETVERLAKALGVKPAKTIRD